MDEYHVRQIVSKHHLFAEVGVTFRIRILNSIWVKINILSTRLSLVT